MDKVTKPGRGRHQRRLALLGVAIGLTFGWLAVWGVDWGEVGSNLADVSALAVAGALTLTIASGYLRAVRWRLLWARQRVTIARLFLVENAGLGLNNISPLRIWDEFAIFGMLTLRDKLPPAQVIATMIMARVQDLLFTLAFIAVVIAATPQISSLAGPVAFGSLIFVFLLLGMLNFGTLARRVPWLKRMPGLETYGTAVRSLFRRKRLLSLTLSVTAVYWLLLGPVGFVLGRAMGVELSLAEITVVILGTMFFASTVPSLPGAWGTFEAAAVQLLGLWDVPQATALSFAVVLHVVLFAPPIVIGIFVLPREGIGIMTAFRTVASANDTEERAHTTV